MNSFSLSLPQKKFHQTRMFFFFTKKAPNSTVYSQFTILFLFSPCSSFNICTFFFYRHTRVLLLKQHRFFLFLLYLFVLLFWRLIKREKFWGFILFLKSVLKNYNFKNILTIIFTFGTNNSISYIFYRLQNVNNIRVFLACLNGFWAI